MVVEFLIQTFLGMGIGVAIYGITISIQEIVKRHRNLK
jgi:hypothetical protein